MAIYTTLFVATDAELSELFPGWRYPRKRPLKLTLKNPFTGEPMPVTIWDRLWTWRKLFRLVPTLLDARGRRFLPPLVPPEHDYSEWLEEGTPPVLRSLPHCSMKGLIDLDALAAALVGIPSLPARFVNCRMDEGVIMALPSHAIQPLSEVIPDRINEVAHSWLQALEGKEVLENLVFAVDRLRPLSQIALQRSGNLFCHMA